MKNEVNSLLSVESLTFKIYCIMTARVSAPPVAQLVERWNVMNRKERLLCLAVIRMSPVRRSFHFRVSLFTFQFPLSVSNWTRNAQISFDFPKKNMFNYIEEAALPNPTYV